MTPVKPGWRSSEMWLATATIVLGALQSAGIWNSGSTAQRAIGAALAALGAIGALWSRTSVKNNAATAEAPKP